MGVVEDGTAIGMGLATAVNRLKDSKARSKVIILLTDGQNNAGEIDPGTAADLAVTYGIKIYSIGAGTKGMARYPIQDPIFGKRYQNMKVDIDEPMLISMAQMTGGKYYRATDSKSLQAIYDEIDSLEKTKVDELIYTDYQELYEYFLLPALALLAISMLLSKTLEASLNCG
jgi:Ca-activated chloride channel family protein